MSATATEVTEDGGLSGRGQRRRQGRALAQALTVVAAVGGALAAAAPTGTAGVDIVLGGAFAALVAAAAGKARRWPVLALPLAAVGLASGWMIVPALGSAITAIMSSTRRRRERAWGAATAVLALQPMLRADDLGFFGLPSLIVAVTVAPVVVSAYRVARARKRLLYRRVAYGVIGATTLIVLAYGGLVAYVASDVEQAATDARQGLNATRQGETDEARAAFRRAAGGFGDADSLLNAWWAAPARAVPVLSQHARALSGAASEGHDLAVAADDTLVAADYQDLRYSDGRFDLARIQAVQEPLDRTLEQLDGARGSLAADDSPWLLAPLADALDDLDGELADARDEGELASQAIEVAPRMLGAEGPRRYFIAFVTPAEVRGSGGFMGSWAEVTATDGELRLTASGSVRELGENTPPGGIQVTGPEEYLTRWGGYVGGREFIGDFGYSPHFPYSAQVMAEMYPQLGGQPVDGVISIDPIALAALLEFTGPLDVPGFGQRLNADNAAEFLLRDNYRLFPDNDAQNDALAELVELTFDELTTGNLPGPSRIAEVLSPATQQGRLRVWTPDADEQALFERIGASGAFPEPEPGHDFLALSSQNSGNNKIDVYQSRRIEYDVALDGEGGLEATARVTVRNDAPIDGSVPEYVVGNADGDPLGTNRMLLSIHTPHVLERATVDGSPIGMQSQSEAGYRVYTVEIAVPPGGEVVLELELSGSLADESDYVLDLAPHPMVVPDQLTVTLDPGSGEIATRRSDGAEARDQVVIPRQ